MPVKPAVWKVDVKDPFEMIVVYCVSFPKSVRGHVGMLIMVDHKSKFAYPSPIKSKRSRVGVDVIRQVLLSMCKNVKR